ncbi:ABC transporter ATP-binding protein [Legionella dresdenensis]|uniref:ABC transporter ATP-binding protein n=1 Tax=Legionella dresdenensis TaxID=450200 RepID=A0ABV8CBW0_9GAMM
MAAVNIVNVSKYYGEHIILDQVSLAIEAGEFVAVVGPSGCGKSTLLRLVAGLDKVSSGDILINNQCVNKIPAADRDMAMVFQSYALYPHMSVFDNMAYGLKMRGFKKSAITKKVTEVAEMLQLSEYLQRKPKDLSGGQRQRVAMGRAIARSPAVFLFDEPLSNLDAKLRTEMRHEIKRLHQELNTTCLYVTHDQTEAMTMASRVLVLNKGKIEQVGTPQTLYQQPASLFVAGFTGHYPINFIPARLDLTQKTMVTEWGLAIPLPELSGEVANQDGVMLGIRPEHLKLTTTNQPQSLSVKIRFIDDMGADKLIHVQSLCGRQQLSVRVAADEEISEHNLAVQLSLDKANLYHQKTGLRLGGWCG